MATGAAIHPVVVPRVSFTPDGATQPLERIVRGMLDSSTRGLVFLRAQTGAGKTTALAYLHHALGPDAPLELLDSPTDAQVPENPSSLTIVAREEPPARNCLARLYLAPWSEDDWIEYCAAAHRTELAWILARLRADEHRDELQGCPRLWRAVLDELAEDEKLPDTAAALRARLRKITTPKERRQLADFCAWTVIIRDIAAPPMVGYEAIPADARAMAEHRAFRLVGAAAGIAEKVALQREGKSLNQKLPRELIRHIAYEVRQSPPATQRLEKLLRKRSKLPDSNAASILLAANPMWHIRQAIGRRLDHANLAHAKWPGVTLQHAHLTHADLHDADLENSDLREVVATDANFRGGKLPKAKLDRAILVRATFAFANLCDASFAQTTCDDANFSRADLRAANFSKAKLNKAKFSGAHLLSTNFNDAELDHVNFEDADFIGTFLDQAKFMLVNFQSTHFTNVSFANTDCLHCNFEGMHLPGVNFANANLLGSLFTGTYMPRASFFDANLTNCGLAEVEWEGVDLRKANLRGASFHMGSSRSGLVGSVIPCEGSKTGFYTDDYGDQDFKSPEEIRKANLRGADLRGAIIDGVDFYLVDLRDALYTPDQAKHLAATGAILHSRNG